MPSGVLLCWTMLSEINYRVTHSGTSVLINQGCQPVKYISSFCTFHAGVDCLKALIAYTNCCNQHFNEPIAHIKEFEINYPYRQVRHGGTIPDGSFIALLFSAVCFCSICYRARQCGTFWRMDDVDFPGDGTASCGRSLPILQETPKPVSADHWHNQWIGCVLWLPH